MTSHQQLMGNTPRSCPSSPTTPPAHTDQPTQRSSGQQGASPLTHSPKPGPKGPGSVSHRCAFPMLRMKANCRLDGPGNMSSTRKASPPAPRGKSTQVENGIYQTTCAERLCVLPSRGAGAAGGKSGKRSTGGGWQYLKSLSLPGYCSESGPVDRPYQALLLHSTYFMAMS